MRKGYRSGWIANRPNTWQFNIPDIQGGYINEGGHIKKDLTNILKGTTGIWKPQDLFHSNYIYSHFSKCFAAYEWDKINHNLDKINFLYDLSLNNYHLEQTSLSNTYSISDGITCLGFSSLSKPILNFQLCSNFTLYLVLFLPLNVTPTSPEYFGLIVRGSANNRFYSIFIGGGSSPNRTLSIESQISTLSPSIRGSNSNITSGLKLIKITHNGDDSISVSINSLNISTTVNTSGATLVPSSIFSAGIQNTTVFCRNNSKLVALSMWDSIISNEQTLIENYYIQKYNLIF